MTTEVVLFDFFGTLVDYEPDVTRLAYPATHRQLAEWGSQLSHDEFVIHWGLSSASLEERSAVTHAEYSMIDAAAAFAERSAPWLDDVQVRLLASMFLDEWRTRIEHIGGVADLINRLSGSFRLGVVSNTHDPAMVPDLLAAMGVSEAFEMVLLSVDHGHRKPHPSIYDAALAMMDAKPAHTAFVGDSFTADYLGPTNAGMSAYLIDPSAAHPVPPNSRLADILDLEAALS